MLNEKIFWQEIRAALLKQAHDLQEQRAAVLQQAAVIERYYELKGTALEQLEKHNENVVK